MSVVSHKQYQLTEENRQRSLQEGLASANWYTTPIARDKMRQLLVRRDGPAIRDTLLLFASLIGIGYVGFVLWGSYWAIIPFLIYGAIYASTGDSRWHETLHGTAFKSDWLNNLFYEISSFMGFRESTPWRWSHTRHHSDTIIVGSDPEIGAPRPPDVKGLLLDCFNLKRGFFEFRKMVIHACGKMTSEECTYIPPDEYPKTYFKARIFLLIFSAVIGLALVLQSWLPPLYIGLPSFYGVWLAMLHALPQHAGLAEDVLDHRLNSRTVYMNPVNQFLYWNMNYHVEHHMFPLVPYHALPKLHELIKHDCPRPYATQWESYREIIPTLLRQVKEPTYFVQRELPQSATSASEAQALTEAGAAERSVATVDDQGWVEVCEQDALEKEDVLRFNHGDKTFAIYRAVDNTFYATDGVCTHGKTHLADGMVKGHLIECPKHNGRFDIRDGSPQRPPVCVGLTTYPVREQEGKIFLNVTDAAAHQADSLLTHAFRVVKNENVATFIKELVLEPVDQANDLNYTPGDYLQFNIPAYEMHFDQIDVQEPYRTDWQEQGLFDCQAANTTPARRNYSMASNAALDSRLHFNVRIATPPAGIDCNAGIGSSYVFNLKSGDTATAIGPFGDFHPKQSEKEMVYLGGGSGMAPLRAHLSYLFETVRTHRRVSFWYGARSLRELFYQDYFEQLAKHHSNFTFHVALSEPQAEDKWSTHTGFIHETLKKAYLDQHSDPSQIEFYLCGPPAMIEAARTMLNDFQVDPAQIAYDEF